MADEVTLMFETSLPIPMIVANGTGIEQGAVLKGADPFTVLKTAAVNDLFGGVAAGEKIASDGVLTIPVYLSGIFKGTASGNITYGDPIATAAAGFENRFYTVVGTSAGLLSGNRIFGRALETATTGQTFLFELKSAPFVVA